MVADSGFSEEQLCELFQRRSVKALKVAVGAIVAQAHAEAVHVLCSARRLGIAVDFFKLRSVGRARARQPRFLTQLDDRSLS